MVWNGEGGGWARDNTEGMAMCASFAANERTLFRIFVLGLASSLSKPLDILSWLVLTSHLRVQIRQEGTRDSIRKPTTRWVRS